MGIFSKASYVSRKRKLSLFYESMRPTENTLVLDVGAEVLPVADPDIEFIASYQWKKNVSAINISAEHIQNLQQAYPDVDARVGDACALPWPDNHFDIAFSNAVIEHVGDFKRQQTMASEVMRVAKRWFITTPNRWYPFEFHLRLPLVTWLPAHGYLWAGRLIGYDHNLKRYTLGNPRIEHLRLLTAKEFRSCFPNSRIVRQRVTFMPETLIAIGEENH